MKARAKPTQNSLLSRQAANLGRRLTDWRLLAPTIHSLTPQIAVPRRGVQRVAAVAAFLETPDARTHIEGIVDKRHAKTFVALVDRTHQTLALAGVKLSYLTRAEATPVKDAVQLRVTIDKRPCRLVMASPIYVGVLRYLGDSDAAATRPQRAEKVKWLLSQPDAADLFANPENAGALQRFLKNAVSPRGFPTALANALSNGVEQLPWNEVRRVPPGQAQPREMPGAYGEARRLLDHLPGWLGTGFSRRLSQAPPDFRARTLYEGELRTEPNRQKLRQLMMANDALKEATKKLAGKPARLSADLHRQLTALWLHVIRELENLVRSQEYQRVLASEKQLGPRWREELGLQGTKAKP